MARYPDIRDLQLLAALARFKHFAQAADDCGISQPAFSARIRNLEAELRIPIVRRGNRFLGFTAEGEVVLKWARKILADAGGLVQEIEVAKGVLTGNLVIGVIPTALPYAAEISARLRQKHPDLAIEIQSLSSTQITKKLCDFSLGAGITYGDEDGIPSIRFQHIYDEQYVLLAPAQLAPRKKGYASWKEAAQLPLCLLTRDMRNRQIVDETFEGIGIDLVPAMETNAFTAALAQVASGAAATIVPQRLADSLFFDSNSVRLPLSDPTVIKSVGLATADQEPIMPYVVALKDAIKSAS
jgi:DNA-binding transcriptional LysR family regulator